MQSLRVDIAELSDAGADRVATLAVTSVRGRQSGVELKIPAVVDPRHP
jgi:hypothetical protein